MIKVRCSFYRFRKDGGFNNVRIADDNSNIVNFYFQKHKENCPKNPSNVSILLRNIFSIATAMLKNVDHR